MLRPTQQRILKLLSDGEPHSKQEIFDCLDDNLSQMSAIRKHISLLRKILREEGHDILIQYMNNRIYYRHVILLGSTTE